MEKIKKPRLFLYNLSSAGHAIFERIFVVYTLVFFMPPDEYTRIAGYDMKIFLPEKLIFGCKGDFAEQETLMGETSNGLSYVQSSQEQNIIQGYYNLKHMVLFAKCTNLCNSLTIYLKNSFPIVIEFCVGSLGDLKLALAPKVVL